MSSAPADRRVVRAAAAQCEIGTDVTANIATLVRMVGEAASQGAELVVLPEFGNHLSIYDSSEHAWEVAIDTSSASDRFVSALAAAAADNQVWVVANATVRRAPRSASKAPRITITQMLFSPTDGLVAQADKQVLMGAERTYLSGADAPSEVVDTPLGRIGMYCCMDGVIAEPARALAVGGAEILCNSLNSFAADEASLHVPVRAVENGVWIVACCKVGPLLPPERVAEFSGAVDLPASVFNGAGESQIVAPDGSVVARGPTEGEAVVIAEVDLGAVADRRRPDGTALLQLRRPELYAPIALDVPPLPATGADSLEVAAIQGPCGDIESLAAQVAGLAAEGVALIVLPELASQVDGLVADPGSAAIAGRALAEEIRRGIAGTTSHVALSVVEVEHRDGDAGPGTGEQAYSHVGLLLSAEGTELHQPALHRPQRHASWQQVMGERVKVFAAPFGRISVLVGDDALVAESARLAVLGGAEVLAVPFSTAEPTDLSLVLAERCAENRLCLVAASRPCPAGAAGAFDPPLNPVWSRPDRPGPFDGTINDPLRHHGDVDSPELRAVLHPRRGAEKLITTDTDLVFGRRPELRGPLVSS